MTRMRFGWLWVVFVCAQILSVPAVSAKTIKVSVNPPTAAIVRVDASDPGRSTPLGVGNVQIKLKDGETLQIRAELPGFLPSRIFLLDKSSEKNLAIRLESWLVKIEGSPADAEVFADDALVGKVPADVIVPKGKRVRVELRKPGFEPVALLPTLDNQPTANPPVKRQLQLETWLLQLNTAPGVVVFRNGVPGTGALPVTKGSRVSVRIEKEGFVPKEFVFENLPTSPHPGASVDLRFDRRIVHVSTRTPGAQIRTVPAQPPVATGTKTIEIERDACVEAQITMPGHEIIKREYCFLDGEREPPLKDNIPALRPAVQVRVNRPLGARILFNGVDVGTQTATIPLPDDVEKVCYTLRIEKPGFVPLEEVRCDRSSPLQRELSERLVHLTAAPAETDIMADGRKIGTGNADLTLRDQQKVKIRGELAGFVSSTEIEYRNDGGDLTPPQPVAIQLAADPAFDETVVAADQANKNFTIEVNSERTYDDAWKLMSLVVLNKFDVIEVTDKDTGYMLSAWEVRDFGSTLVRTRMIVKLGDQNPLKFVVKLASEHGEKPPTGAPPGSETKFRDFARLLPKFKDVINELTFRLR